MHAEMAAASGGFSGGMLHHEMGLALPMPAHLDPRAHLMMPSPLRPPMAPPHARPRGSTRPPPAKPLDVAFVSERLHAAHLGASPLSRDASCKSPDRRRAQPSAGRRTPPRRTRVLASAASSQGSPGKDSQVDGAAKTKVEPRVGAEGELVFNARQRRTLRRALQRQRKVAIGDGRDFDVAAPFSEVELALIADVISQHISGCLPPGADVERLARTLLSLGDADLSSPGAE